MRARVVIGAQRLLHSSRALLRWKAGTAATWHGRRSSIQVDYESRLRRTPLQLPKTCLNGFWSFASASKRSSYSKCLCGFTQPEKLHDAPRGSDLPDELYGLVGGVVPAVDVHDAVFEFR